MDISQLGKQLGLGMLKQASVQPKLALVPGTVVTANVLSVHPPDLAVLLLGGVQLTAKINQLPTAGEQLSLRVAGQNPSTGQFELQVVSGSDALVQTQTQAQRDAAYTGWLQTLSKPDRQLAEQVSAVLDHAAIPALPEEVKPIVAALSGQQQNEALIKTAILSQALGLPLEPTVFHALEAVWVGPSIGTLVDQMNQNVAQNATEPHSTQADPLPSLGPSDSETVNAQLLSNQSVNTVAPADASHPQLEALKSIYQELNSALSQGDSSKAQLLLNQVVQTVGLADDARMYRFLLRNVDSSEPIHSDQTSLKQLLLAQVASTDERAAPDQGPGDGSAGSSTVQSHLLNHLLGQQLLHGTHSGSPFSYQNFALPLYFSHGKTGSAHIHLLGHEAGPGGRQLDASNCTLFFRLDLPELGPTDLYVQVIERTVSIRFTVEPNVTLPLMPSDVDELQSALSQFGYRLGNVNTATRDEVVSDPLFFYITEMRSRTNSIHLLA